MPMIPTDMDACRAMTKRSEKERRAAIRKARLEREADEAALAKMRDAAAAKLGADPSEITVTMCRRNRR